MGKIDYIQAFHAGATQLNTRVYGREWCEMGVSLEDAIAWANSGHMPAEAAPLIADGITPQMAAEMDDLATEISGGPEEHAAQVIDGLVADGTLIDPSRVRIADDGEHVQIWIDEA